MYTPQEVSEKTFPKSSGLSSGYSMTAVDEFLDGLTEDYTALYKDNTTLKAKLKVLAEKVEEYRATEDAMRSTLLAAQKMAAQMVAEAQAERDKSIAEAHAEKEKTISNAQAEAQRLLIEAGDPGFLGEAGCGPKRDGELYPAQPGAVRPADGVSGCSAGAECAGAGGAERGRGPACPPGERRACGGGCDGCGACFSGGAFSGAAARPGASAGGKAPGEERGGFPLSPGL